MLPLEIANDSEIEGNPKDKQTDDDSDTGYILTKLTKTNG